MTLEKIIRQKLIENQPAEGRRLSQVGEDRWSATLTTEHRDQIGCLIWELALHRVSPQGDLTAWAQAIPERVTGLLEPLKVLEIDALRNEALLRSQAPSKRAGEACYYEIILKGTSEALLRRFQANITGDRRQQQAFSLTYEALAKLLRDLAS